jgi:hypothetical protein
MVITAWITSMILIFPVWVAIRVTLLFILRLGLSWLIISLV